MNQEVFELYRLAALASSGAAAVPFEIINAGLAGVDSDGTETQQAWTTAADTTLLVVAVSLGGSGVGGADDFSAMSFNGAAMTEIGVNPDHRNTRPGHQWWVLQNPDIGSFNLTYTKAGAGWDGNSYHAVQCFNIRGAHATPIGATDLPLANNTGSTSRSDAITSLHDNSILLSAGVWQNGTAALSPLESLAELNEAATGGSTTVDGVSAIGWKALAAAGAYNYGWASSVSDGQSISAVEIRRA